MGHCDAAAVAASDTDYRSEAQILPQRLHVLHVLIQCVLGRISPRRPALTPVVEVHELQLFDEPPITCFPSRVIGTWSSGYEHCGRPLAHALSVHHMAAAINVKEQLGIADTRS